MRFSLRLLLAATAILSILLYACMVRPTLLANRFVTAVNAQDIETVDRFFADEDWREETNMGATQGRATRMDHIYADLIPRGMNDWLRCRRRIVLRIARHLDTNDQHVEWTEDIDLMSRATGITIWPAERPF